MIDIIFYKKKKKKKKKIHKLNKFECACST